LPAIMKWMKQTFAQRYNREAGWIGHVWGDRYWSRILVGEPPGEENGGAAGVLNMGVRPHNRKNEGPPGFPLIVPRPATPATG
ncbi:MAG: hypothetical protein LBB83_00260, partial [Treponema sp.]|nr:hypothetical protein [Treponema sp.]